MGKSVAMWVLVLVGVLCLVAASAEAGVIAVSSAHASVTVPTGWAVERNYTDTETGLTYDLYVSKSLSSTDMALGMFGHEVQLGSFSPEDLYHDLQSGMEDSGFTDFTYVVAPRNFTLGGLPACEATITVNTGMVTVKERFTSAFSHDWHLLYTFVFAAVSTSWSSYSSAIDSMILSLKVDEKAGGAGASSTLYLAIGLIVVAAAVVVIVVLLMMRKKKPEPFMVPSVEMPPAPPGPPPTT